MEKCKKCKHQTIDHVEGEGCTICTGCEKGRFYCRADEIHPYHQCDCMFIF